MASMAPAKSQPLHNFELAHLQWSKDEESSGQSNRRRSNTSPSLRPNTLPDSAIGQESSRPSPTPEFTEQPLIDEGESARVDSEVSSKKKGPFIEYRRNHCRNSPFDGAKIGANASSSKQEKDKLKKSNAAEDDPTGSKISKILIRFPCKNNNREEENSRREIGQNDEQGGVQAAVAGVRDVAKTNNGNAEETKTWNLRPRKTLLKPHSMAVGAGKSSDTKMAEKSKALPAADLNQPGQKEGKCGSSSSEQKEKRKLSISIALTKGEIEEDFLAMTRSKPARRPKKRARNVQKQLDFLFPGLRLVSITPDSYKVSESSLKG